MCLFRMQLIFWSRYNTATAVYKMNFRLFICLSFIKSPFFIFPPRMLKRFTYVFLRQNIYDVCLTTLSQSIALFVQNKQLSHSILLHLVQLSNSSKVRQTMIGKYLQQQCCTLSRYKKTYRYARPITWIQFGPTYQGNVMNDFKYYFAMHFFVGSLK